MWLLYLLLAIIIIVIEVYRKKEFFFDFLSFFNLYFIGYYLFPAFIYNASFIEYHGRYEKYLGELSGSFKAFILIFMSYVFVLLGYQYLAKKIKLKRINNNNNTEKKHYDFSGKVIIITSIVLWIIGLLSLFVYSRSFGGIVNLILNSGHIRDGNYVSSGDGSLEFIRRFIVALIYPSYFLFAYFLKNQKLLLLLIFSIVISFLWFFINAGRGAILQYILILFLIYALVKNKKINILKTSFIGFIFFVGINYLRPFFNSLMYLKDGVDVFKKQFIITSTSGRYSIEGFKDVIYTFSYYLEHKYVSLEVAIKSVDSGRHIVNFFSEFGIAILSLIPSKFLFFEKPDSIIFHNTYYITGIYESSIPPGAIALGYYSLSSIGVVIFSVGFGLLGKKLNDYFMSINNVISKPLYVSSMFVWLDLFVAGEIRQTLQRYFVYILLLAFFIIKSKVRWRS
ncbi:O-antigen polymerase [Exiguobacterium sp. s95]|uniref:O-antigen polymerase n=1 Tax=Exiguobacterium sp. s95 TaxID=2751211 RepID=UPI001BECFFF6|nr:O-antigen polymerase [Exiguobacterium sp. s95]